MKVSDIIKTLQEIKDKHGDVKAAIDVDGSYFTGLYIELEFPIDVNTYRGGEPLLVIR